MPRSGDEEPISGRLSPTDAATIVRTLGAVVVTKYGGGAADEKPGERTSSAWGSKQRELLLRALIDRVALHARTFENAALSATDAGIAAFAREEFKKAATRSRRDRSPITKNIDKVVGGWLRHLGRKMKQDAVVVFESGTVALRERTATFRLTLSFTYRRRIVHDRRLLLSATFEELGSKGWTLLPFRAEAKAPEVALPEKRRLKATEERHLHQLLQSLKAFADIPDDDELRDELRSYADAGLRRFVPWSAPKILVAVFASVLACTMIAGAAEWIYQRINSPKITPHISTQCSPTPAVILRFTSLPRGGVRIERGGVPLQMKGGVAIDEHPMIGRNTYAIHAVGSILVPWQREVVVEVPACPPPPCPTPPCDVTGSMKLNTTRGEFELTNDKTGFGDAPAGTQKLQVQTNHGDEHLDAYITEDCDECRRNVRFVSYLGAIEEPDVKITIDFGDSSDALELFGYGAATGSATGFDVLRSHVFKQASADSDGSFYSIFAPHQYADEGSYVVTVVAMGRRDANESYEHVKTLRRRIRVGAVPSIEMFESFHFPTTSTSD